MAEASESEFEFTFDRGFLHRAHWRDYYWRPLALSAPLAAYLAYRHFTGTLGGNLGLWIGVTILAIFALSLFFYLRRIARVYSTWQRLSPETKTLRFRVSETGIACLTENSQERVEWSKLFRLWIYADVWILEILKMQSMVFPPSAALESTRDQIVEHCRSAGRPVIRGRRFFP